jgi:phage-related protein
MRRIIWVGRSRADLAAFPSEVRKAFGYGLWQAQQGDTPDGAAPLPQFDSGVFELKDRFDGDAYRSVYIVKLKKAVYVLHVFKKKSKSGKAMPREDINLIRQRLARARDIDTEEN